MASKFSKYRGSLEQWKPEASYQEKVEEIKKSFADQTIQGLSDSMRACEAHKDAAEENISLINISIEAISQLLVDQLDGLDAESLKLESGASVRIDYKPYVSILPTPEAKEAYEKWENSAKIRKMKTLNAQRRDAIIKEEFLEKARPVPGWCKLYLKVRAKISKGGS